jgi:hypothetical protein
MYTAPDSDCPSPSKPSRCAYGPLVPNALVATRMARALSAEMLAWSSPMARSVAPGMLAITMSLRATSRRTISRPSGAVGSSVSDRLPRFTCMYSPPSPLSANGRMKRSSLPPTLSMRITSAPWSASSAAQNGPAMKRPKSSTRMPASTPSLIGVGSPSRMGVGRYGRAPAQPARHGALYWVALATAPRRAGPRTVSSAR